MGAALQRDVVGQLVGVEVTLLGRGRGRAEVGHAGDVDRRAPAVVGRRSQPAPRRLAADLVDQARAGRRERGRGRVVLVVETRAPADRIQAADVAGVVARDVVEGVARRQAGGGCGQVIDAEEHVRGVVAGRKLAGGRRRGRIAAPREHVGDGRDGARRDGDDAGALEVGALDVGERKARSRTSGPDRLPPYCHCDSGSSRVASGFRASSASSRK